MKYLIAMLENGVVKDAYNLSGISLTGKDNLDLLNVKTLTTLSKYANRRFYFATEDEYNEKDFQFDWIEIVELLDADGVYIAIKPHGFVLLVSKSDGIYIYSIDGDEGLKYHNADDNVYDFMKRNELDLEENSDIIEIYLHSFYDLYS